MPRMRRRKATTPAKPAGVRKRTADLLTQMVVMHWVKRGAACFVQQGVNSWGKLRADVVAMWLNGAVTITEVKSCRADFTTDNKWPQYREYCDKLYFAFPSDLGLEVPKGIGVLVPDGRGHLKAIQNASEQRMVGKTRKALIVRLAWRAGTFSKRNTRRTRMFLEDQP